MGTACSDSTLQCWYEDGTVCSCSACSGGREYPLCQSIDPPEWACVKPPSGCPNPAPQAGTACTATPTDCGISCEEPIRCSNGFWEFGDISCPVCAAPDTPIATPSGERAIAELRVGDLVYSVDRDAIVAVPIVRVGSTPVIHHRVLRLTLSNGAVLHVSPGHPLPSGAPLSTLRAGSAIDHTSTVVALELEPYGYTRTYDILPRSSSGNYFAGGVELGSTLASTSTERTPSPTPQVAARSPLGD
jgi:hypothetical protein